jgi:hypothetical protein
LVASYQREAQVDGSAGNQTVPRVWYRYTGQALTLLDNGHAHRLDPVVAGTAKHRDDVPDVDLHLLFLEQIGQLEKQNAGDVNRLPALVRVLKDPAGFR